MTAAAIVTAVIVCLGTILVVEALNRVADALGRLALAAEAEEKRRAELDRSFRR